MVFSNAKCELCNQDQFNPDDVLAFRYVIETKGIRPVRLDGQQPWCGIRCVCKRCIAVIQASPMAFEESKQAAEA